MMKIDKLFSLRSLIVLSLISGSAEASEPAITQLFEKKVCTQSSTPRKGGDGVIILGQYAVELMSDKADLKYVSQTKERTSMYVSLNEALEAIISLGDRKSIDMPIIIKDLINIEVGRMEEHCCLSSFGEQKNGKKIIYTFPDIEGEAIMFDEAATRDITNIYLGVDNDERYVKMTFFPRITCRDINIYKLDQYTKIKMKQESEH